MSIQTFSKIGEDNYVVVFRSLLSENSKGYPQMAERMMQKTCFLSNKVFSAICGFCYFLQRAEQLLHNSLRLF